MNAQRIQEVVAEALELACGERDRFLLDACAGDDALRREAESLLEAARNAGPFMSDPTALTTAGALCDGPSIRQVWPERAVASPRRRYSRLPRT